MMSARGASSSSSSSSSSSFSLGCKSASLREGVCGSAGASCTHVAAHRQSHVAIVRRRGSDGFRRVHSFRRMCANAASTSTEEKPSSSSESSSSSRGGGYPFAEK